jgi:hypothetical protein
MLHRTTVRRADRIEGIADSPAVVSGAQFCKRTEWATLLARERDSNY